MTQPLLNPHLLDQAVETLRRLSLTPEQRLQESIEHITAIQASQEEDTNDMDDQELVFAIKAAVGELNSLLKCAWDADIEVELSLTTVGTNDSKTDLDVIRIDHIRRVEYLT